MLDPSFADSLWSGLLSGGVPVVALAVAGAAGKLYKDRRKNVRDSRKNIVERQAALEERQARTEIGLFGEDTKFGHRDGFVDEVRANFAELRTEIAKAVEQLTHNGGASARDDITAIRDVVAPRDEES